jgi:rhomboid protease GluP
MTLPDQQPKEELPPQRYTPIKYDFPAKTPTASYALLGLTIVVFGLQQLTTYLFQVDLLAGYLAKINEMIYQGQVWRLITPALVHADIIHIGFNMYALWIIGRRLERIYGHHRFLILYILSAFAGNLVSFYLTPNPSLGASTAIFGLLAAEGVYIYNNRRYFPNAQKALVNLLIILAFNIFYGLTIPNIDVWGHLGGFLGGLGFAWFAGPMIIIQREGSELRLQDVHLGKTELKIGLLEFAILGCLTAFRIFVNQ